MITISLDEGGKFEQHGKPQCMLIGGLAYHCGGESDLHYEKQNLERFFKQICSEQGGQYPDDLHPLRDKSGAILNLEKMGKVKTALESELPDFLQKKGRWRSSKPANGFYDVFCMVGDQRPLDDHSSSSLHDDIATIRYDHMIYRTIDNILFYNPCYSDEKDYNLHLPTRVIDLRDRDINRAKLEPELKTLGYRRRWDKDSSTFDPNVYEVTDETSFRTNLESALLNSDRTDLTFNLMVQSISYRKANFHQVFLYLADTLCSVFQNAISGITTCDEALPALKKCCDKLTGSKRYFLWAYHPIDRMWRRIWDSFNHGNWFEALMDANTIRTSNTPLDNIYQDIWIKPFEKRLTEKNDFSALSEGFYRLDQYMLNLSDRKQGTGLYIMDQLKKNFNMIKDEKERGKLEYRVSKIMTGLYNHNGDFVHAQEEYQKCVKSAKYVPIEEFLGLQYHYATSLNDAQRYAESEKICSELVSHHELLNEIKAEIDPDNQLLYDSYGRALSQHGQSLVFLKRHEEGIACFRKALSLFEKGQRDWGMTGSFLLHALIDANDKDGYLAEAKNYFGSGSFQQRFKRIRGSKGTNDPYSMFLILKGLWVFGDNRIDPKVIEDTINQICVLRQSADPHHPWEMIMKYCAFLWVRYFEKDGDHSRSNELMDSGRVIVKNAAGILKDIAEENDRQYQRVLNGENYTAGSKLNFTYI